MHQGHPRMIGVSTRHENERKVKMVVKEISRKIFRRITLESGPIVHLGGGPMTVRKNDPAIRLGG